MSIMSEELLDLERFFLTDDSWILEAHFATGDICIGMLKP